MLCKIKWPTLISNPRKIMQNTFCFLFFKKKKKIKKEQPRMKGFLKKKKKNYKTQTILLVRQRLKLIWFLTI